MTHDGFRTALHRRSIAVSMLVLVGLLTSACTSSTSSAPSSSPAEPTGTPAGLASIDASVMGNGHYPGFTVQAPSTWSTDGYFVMNHTGGVVEGISVWDVGQVPRNPCHWRGHLVRSRTDGRRSRRGARGPADAPRHDADRRDARRLPGPVPPVVRAGATGW